MRVRNQASWAVALCAVVGGAGSGCAWTGEGEGEYVGPVVTDESRATQDAALDIVERDDTGMMQRDEPTLTRGGPDSGTPSDAGQAADDPTAVLPPWEQPGPWDDGAVLPESIPDEGDPELGRWQILNGDYMGCGMPYRFIDDPLVKALFGQLPGERIPGRSGKNADMPYFANAFETKEGATVVNLNCLACHAGRFDGELVIGLGNPLVDYTSGPLGPGVTRGDALTALALLGATEAELFSADKLLRVSDALDGRDVMPSIGTNPADMVGVVLGQHRRPEDLTWSEEPLVDAIFYDVDGKPREDSRFTVDTPPWWRVHKKSALLYNGMSRGYQRGTMTTAAAVCIDDEDDARRVDQIFKDVRAFVASIRAPKYPFEIDHELASRGRPIYERLCAGCHGTYAKNPSADEEDSYPNLLISVDEVGTDPVVAEWGTVHAPQSIETWNASFYGTIAQLVPGDPFPGYNAPPLDGIWATAPYLHNGSVPTLELLLDSTRRPTFWKRETPDTTVFDEDALGFPYVELPYAPEYAPEEERKHIFDTTRYSQGNEGHTYGDVLFDLERRALLEYLKTL